MPAINQRIPNFLGGVSQQPDTIKFPGQLRVCDNAVPDVTFGLKKRPPGEFVDELNNANDSGYWYEILRDGDEKYIMQITPANVAAQPIKIWNLATGLEQNFTNNAGDPLYSYLAGANKKYAVQSIQDYTIIANPTKEVATTGNTDLPLNGGDYAFARLDTIGYNTEYVMYTSHIAPTPVTYYRVTALSINKHSGSPSGNTRTGNTWDDTDKNGKYTGLAQFSFSDSACEDVEGHVTVNAASYVDSNTANYQEDDSTNMTTSGDGEDFIGYTQNYKVRYTAQVTLKDGGLIKTTDINTALGKSHTVTIEGVNYTVNVDAVEPVKTYEGYNQYGNTSTNPHSAPTASNKIAFYRSPKNPDKGKLSMATILEALFSQVNSNLQNVTAEVVGSGLYLHGSSAPTVSFLGGAVNESMNIIGNTAQDISKLPSQCKHGYIAQIANSENVEADNYYVKFLADNGNQGSGRWEECVRPHNFSTNDGSDVMIKGLDPASMPHAIVNNRNGTFTFKKLDEATATTDDNDNYWKYREVGDDTTNPFPSFHKKKIQKIFFHRNRLGIVANEQVVLSRPGDYFNFFIVSAITTSDDNPIDITVSDIKPAYVNHVLEIQKGMMMFSDNGQFLLFSESDIFSPKTARLKKVSSFECDSILQPVDMGASVMFTSNVSAYARAYEATILDDDVPPRITEQTRVVPEYLPKNIDIACNSTAIGINTFAKTDTSEIYHYKYFDSGDRRDQSAWYSWTIKGDLQHCFYTAGSFFTIASLPKFGGKSSTGDDGLDFILSRYEYVADATADRTYTLGSGTVGSPLATSRWFEACLDCMVTVNCIFGSADYQAGKFQYHTPSDGSAPYTALTLPFTPVGTSDLYVVALSGNDRSGNPVAGQVVKSNAIDYNEARFSNVDMYGWVVAVGYSYVTTVELPNYYLAIEPTKYDIDGDLRISGMNFEMGVSGPMEFHITSKYADMDDYIQYESGMKLDESDFGKPPSQLMKSVRVPIQKKNEKYNLTIKIPDPFSTALISGSWDGNYNQRRHVRR